MPIPGPGVAISIQTIVNEFGGTAPHSLSEYYRGGSLVPNIPANLPIPTSGQIALNNFYGTGGPTRVAIPLTLAAPALNYDVYTNRGPTYVAGTSDITVTVNPGVTIGSTATATAAMIVPSAFNPADTVTIVNNGLIQGRGGDGGKGASGSGIAAVAGSGGGIALSVSRPVTVTNPGTIAAGGGGGGGGGGGPRANGGGGGGGAGTNGGTGGAAGGSAPTAAGSPGTSPAGGAGGAGSVGPLGSGGAGGPGGGRGAAGAAGVPSSLPGAPGGGAGNYIVGNPFVTWPVTGTRQGNVA